MLAREVKTIADAIALVEARHLTHVKVAVSDMDGILRGKYISKDKFISSLKSGLPFCDVVLGWDLNDQLYDNVKYTGWHTAYPDVQVKLLPHTCRDLPLEPGTDGDMLFFLGEFGGSLATKSRDHLFDMLGLAYDADDAAFNPNYDEPLVRVVCR